MKNAVSITLGVLLLAVVGFARTPNEQPVPHTGPKYVSLVEPEGAAVGSRLSTATTELSSHDSVPDLDAAVAPTQCKTVLSSASDDSDECWECQRECFKAWEECRRHCGPTWYGACHDACTSELEWCLDTNCSSVCD